ncbi:fasciclin domain-containing protein [Azospirillum rugosum]|uniref:FAS1 domain-containing protein n=1 Tax=Azospirillum rugosum TaxID=416170 RepID=A0ABS4SP13_9PROT|nr:fasciclin domain-containing protein [Azospirillum rugosum]MBP2294302.1 hypothetical protein [Azospirillum rugosum]MDQ0527637.1 hypothetical protein [Azospirillum rugosum]
MRFDFVISVWGAWHIGMMNRAMLPTLMSPGNLPAACAAHDIRIRIFTRPSDVGVIDALPWIGRLKALLPVDIVIAADNDAPASADHLAWWERSSADAAARHAVAANIPPDVIWADGAITNLCAIFGTGKRAVLSPPSLRVISETCVAELEERGGGAVLDSAELMALAFRHWHPLSGAAAAGAPHGRPAIEHLWAVAGQGLLVRQSAREVLAYDPRRCALTDKFLLADAATLEDVHVVRDAADIAFLSLAPLAKDFAAFVIEEPTTVLELAKWAAHPHNLFAAAPWLQRVTTRLALPGAEAGSEDWREARRAAAATFDAVTRTWMLHRVWSALETLGCRRAKQVLALALHTLAPSDILRRPRGACTVLVPTDAALAAIVGEDLRSALRSGGEARLGSWLRAHVVAGRHDLADAAPTRLATLDGVPLAVERRTDGRLQVAEGGILGAPIDVDGTLLYPMEGLLRPF